MLYKLGNYSNRRYVFRSTRGNRFQREYTEELGDMIGTMIINAKVTSADIIAADARCDVR